MYALGKSRRGSFHFYLKKKEVVTFDYWSITTNASSSHSASAQAKHSNLGPHTDISVQSQKHTDCNNGYKHHINKHKIETHKKPSVPKLDTSKSWQEKNMMFWWPSLYHYLSASRAI